MMKLLYLLLLMAFGVKETYQDDSLYTIVLRDHSLSDDAPFGVYVTVFNGSDATDVQITLTARTGQQLPAQVSATVTVEAPPSGAWLQLRIPDSWTDGLYRLEAIGNGSATFNHSRELHLAKEVQIFTSRVVTDQDVYQAGDKVRFRVVIVDESGKSIADKETVDVTVWNGNYKNADIIQSWNQVETHNGVFSGELQLDKECESGEFQIVSRYKGRQETSYFYVLDKRTNILLFEVFISAPRYVNPNDTEMEVEVSANYLSGTPVRGSLTLKLSTVFCFANIDCETQTILNLTEFNGRKVVTVPLPSKKPSQNYFLSADVTDVLTYRTQNALRDFSIQEFSSQLVSIKVPHRYFAPELPFRFWVDAARLLDENSNTTELPLILRTIYYQHNNEDNVTDSGKDAIDRQEVLITADNSRYVMTVTPPAAAVMMTIQVDYRNKSVARKLMRKAPYGAPDAGLSILVNVGKNEESDCEQQLCASPDKSPFSPEAFLESAFEPTYQSQGVVTGSNLTVDVYTTAEMNLLTYHVTSIRSYEILDSGSIATSGRGPHRFQIWAGEDAVSYMHLLVYGVTTEGVLIADSRTLALDRANPLEIKLEVSPLKVQPGEMVNFSLKSTPNSHLFFKGVDMESELFFQESLNSLSWLFTFDQSWSHWQTIEESMLDLSHWQAELAGSLHKVENHFLTPRLKLFTNADILHQTVNDVTFRETPSAKKSGSSGRSNFTSSSKARRNFSRTWIWRNLTVGSEGYLNWSSPAPDKISSWSTVAFGVDQQRRIGHTQGPKVIVTKPLYAFLDTPPSLARGEAAQIRILVFRENPQHQVNVTIFSRDKRFQILDEKTHRVVSISNATKYLLPAPGSTPGLGSSFTFLVSPLFVGALHLEAEVRCGSGNNDTVKATISVKEVPTHLRPFVYDAKEAPRYGESDICYKTPASFGLSVTVPPQTQEKLNISFQVNTMNDDLGNLMVNACVKYVHKEATDLTLQIHLPSGFELMTHPLQPLGAEAIESSHKITDNRSKIQWHFQKVDNTFLCVPVESKRTFAVFNLKAAKITAFIGIDLKTAKRAGVYYRAPSFEE